MSLKAFHVVFVVVCTVFTVGFGIWAIRLYRSEGDVSAMVCGVLSLCGAVSLIVYGRWFLRKLKNVSYL